MQEISHYITYSRSFLGAYIEKLIVMYTAEIQRESQRWNENVIHEWNIYDDFRRWRDDHNSLAVSSHLYEQKHLSQNICH